MLKVYQLRLQQNSFDVTLKYKGVGVRVAFVDGNTYNEIPAKCYTNDPFKQRAIEASQMFKDGDIVLERSVEEESDRQKAAEKAAKEAAGQQSQQAPEPAPNTDPEPAGDGSQDKDFANLGEAIMYIAQNWQLQVQTEAEARKVLKEHGINPHIKKG